MTCKQCHKIMSSGSQDGKPIWFCRPCGEMVELPLGGATTQHSPESRKRTLQQGPLNPKLPTEGEVSFMEAWADYVPSIDLVTEYKFCLTREWRLDFAHVASKVAVEYEGYGHGRDNRYKSDITKYNTLAYEGWSLFRCNKAMVEKDAERFCRMVAETIRKRVPQTAEDCTNLRKAYADHFASLLKNPETELPEEDLRRIKDAQSTRSTGSD